MKKNLFPYFLLIIIAWAVLNIFLSVRGMYVNYDMAIIKADTNKNGKVDIYEAAVVYRKMGYDDDRLLNGLDAKDILPFLEKMDPAKLSSFYISLLKRVPTNMAINTNTGNEDLIHWLADTNQDGKVDMDEALKFRESIGKLTVEHLSFGNYNPNENLSPVLFHMLIYSPEFLKSTDVYKFVHGSQ